MQAFFKNVCSGRLPRQTPLLCPPPLTVHTFASYLANVCSWHSITNISFGSMQIWRRLWQLLSQSAPKSMLEFCVLPQGSLLLIFVLPSLCTFGHVILKSISNRVATPSSSPLPFPIPPLFWQYLCMKITNLLSKKGLP